MSGYHDSHVVERMSAERLGLPIRSPNTTGLRTAFQDDIMPSTKGHLSNISQAKRTNQ